MPHRNLLPAFLSLAACGLALSGCTQKTEAEAPEGPAPVQVTSATQENIQRVVDADGVLFPIDQASIMPKISAPVARFNVNRGDHVRADQLLATLENRDLSAAVTESQGQLNQAKSNLRSTSAAAVPEQTAKAQADVQTAQETLDYAKKLLDSRQELLKQGAIARKNVDDAQVAYSQAKSQLETAREHLRVLQSVAGEEQVKTAQAQVEAAQGHLQSAEAQVAYSEVRSPISGVVADRPLNPGEKFKPGAPVHAAILTDTIRNATIVPATAILPGEEGGTAVLVVSSDSTAHLHPVVLGVRNGDKIQVTNGVRPGDEVVIAGGLGVDDKAKVKIVGAATDEAEDEDEPPPPPPAAAGQKK